MKKSILKIFLSTFLCTFLVGYTPLRAEVTNSYSTDTQEVTPRYSQVVNANATFNYQKNTYTVHTSWLAYIEDSSGRLSSASFISSSSNLPDPLYHTLSVVRSERVNNYQIRYYLSVKIVLLGVTQSTVSTSVLLNSPGPI